MSSKQLELSAELIEEIASVKTEAQRLLGAAADLAELERARVAALGLKGSITRLFERLPKLQPAEKRGFGQAANAAKVEAERAYEERRGRLAEEELARELGGERLDVTLPGRRGALGHRHPVSRTIDEIVRIFSRLGFESIAGPEIEFERYNFELLNLPADHPARDMQDTFYVRPQGLGEPLPGKGDAGRELGGVLLRTHTSPMQVRSMLTRKPPLRLIVPGKVYRRDSDLTHTPMFHQVEGLLVDEGVTFADLKGTLNAFVHAFFGEGARTRFRPSYFPFTEPSAEVDVSCTRCSGKGCRLCKETGWLEVLGSGMVHPNVFKAVGHDSERVSGFAFGMGVDRLAMLRYGIDDLRSLFENDARFLQQF